LPRRIDRVGVAGPEEAKNLAGEILRLIQDPFSDAQFGEKLACLSRLLSASALQSPISAVLTPPKE